MPTNLLLFYAGVASGFTVVVVVVGVLLRRAWRRGALCRFLLGHDFWPPKPRTHGQPRWRLETSPNGPVVVTLLYCRRCGKPTELK